MDSAHVGHSSCLVTRMTKDWERAYARDNNERKLNRSPVAKADCLVLGEKFTKRELGSSSTKQRHVPSTAGLCGVHAN